MLMPLAVWTNTCKTGVGQHMLPYKGCKPSTIHHAVTKTKPLLRVEPSSELVVSHTRAQPPDG